MVEKSGETERRIKKTFKEKCTHCISGPKQIIRTTILLTCTVVVVYQIGECLRKIRNPPITTYTHFDFNDTVKYPAITICRDPPYKNDVLQEHGLYGHPRYTSEWRNFNFSNVNLDEFWREATYSDKDNFISAGLNSINSYIEVVNSLHFVLGQCQTVSPKIYVSTVSKNTGYSILLNHSMLEIDTTSSTIPPGYHIFVHQANEPFAEHLSVSLMEHLYVNVGEELEVKLGVQQLNMLSTGPKNCQTEDDYSATLCVEKCVWDSIIDEVGCSGPWMKTDIPYCSNYTAMKELIVNYIRFSNKADCACQQRCRSMIYSTYVMDRNSLTVWNSATGVWDDKHGVHKLQTQLYIYFNNKLVSVYEENHSYDWSLFLADFGGSMGFLLGLSVLGVILILEDIFDSCIKPLVSSDSEKSTKDNRDKKISVSSESSCSINYNDKSDILKDYNKFNIKSIEKNFYM
ncbi:amiloride-sensitive sodium channel pickpocket 17 [Arctopsyche grandis]|uniref:amiloride-sensitive sodium channel pickpocket 17 n=1 Tax=Arctopsyche grandis TaxID=121162 RepID=UPI00406D90DB